MSSVPRGRRDLGLSGTTLERRDPPPCELENGTTRSRASSHQPVSMCNVTAMDASATVESYLLDLRRRGRREHTVRGYGTDLARLVDCAAETGGTLDAAAVSTYTAWARGAAPATTARRLSALRGLLRWCGQDALLSGVKEAHGSADRVGSAASSGEPTHAATRDDVENVLAVIPRQADRDQLLYRVLARLGLRPGEALALRIEDYDEAGRCLQVPGWGGVRRRVLVDDRQVLLRMSNLIRVSGRTSGALFTAPGREVPLRYQSVLARWNRYCAAAGVTVRLSDLRRLHAVELLAGGVPEAIVRDRLGQQSGSLTGGPAGPSTQESDEALCAWHARAAAASQTVESDPVRTDRAG
ncbi:tyrosine-type recombinase/integrase [Humibacter ginsenosidimutans]|uniref:Tyrosine-type recombinase/integrase n=1 Tax=Humibacter ginsenosidimutans TaxID=2599293 RepID=A0A5B8M6X9_9MICO|nr:site-specific integrase [Humibacter ginsenosidimutans]QDZ15362.1 tyrosine-type recombinase/integrase [Humibacter ginsenosidimutans]